MRLGLTNMLQSGNVATVMIPYMPFLSLLNILPKLYNGSLRQSSLVESDTVDAIRFECDDYMDVEIDGEIFHSKTLSITVGKQCLRVICAQDSSREAIPPMVG